MSEMSIECSSPSEEEVEKEDAEMILDDIPNTSLESKLKTVFELPESETLINGRYKQWRSFHC